MNTPAENHAAIKHMDDSLATMRQGLFRVRESNAARLAAAERIWGGGSDRAGNTANKLRAAQEKLDAVDMAMLGVQVELVHALVILERLTNETDGL